VHLDSGHKQLKNVTQPTKSPGLFDTFLCHCTDCRKITASAFTSAFGTSSQHPQSLLATNRFAVITNPHLRHIRGQNHLKTFTQSSTPASGNAMTNFFCDTCGTLMSRTSSGYPDVKILRLGTVDGVKLMEGVLKPRREDFVGDRVMWFKGIDGRE
jgi:hypothetical protein